MCLKFNAISDNPSPKKPPRPISAVPSEYSDVSTSSCRTSDDGADIDDNKNNNTSASTKINTHDPQIIDDEPVTVSIVVSSVPPVPPAHEPKQQPDAGQQQQLLGLLQQPDEVLSKEARMARVHRVASELLSTEEQYVTVLYLIDQVCLTQYLFCNNVSHLIIMLVGFLKKNSTILPFRNYE